MSASRVAAISLVVLAIACRRSPQPSELEQAPAPPTVPASVSSSTPEDHLAPGELVEGPKQAFGIALPRGTQVKGEFVDVVYAGSPAPVDAFARYLRARLEGGSLREGPRTATFERVHVRAKPGLELRVRIAAAPDGTIVEIRDTTPLAAVPLPDEASRWRQVGLTPDGHLLDPKHLE